MPSVISKDQFVEKFRSNSLVLGRVKLKQGKMSSRPIFSISEAKAYLAEILDKRIDPAKGALGFLKSAQIKLKEAREQWNKYNSAQAPHARKGKPHDNFLEQINKCQARILILEEECRALNELVDKREAEEKAAQEVINKKLQTKKRLAGKLKNNILVEMDGRTVIKAGTIFEDNGELVADYIAGVKAERAKFRKQRNAIQSKQAEAADKFFEQTGLTRAA